MICYPELGNIGRLGNHLFQIAATLGAARTLGESYGFPHWQHEKEFPLTGCFFDQLPPGREYREPRYQFDPLPMDRHLQIHGFFQSEQYFSEHSHFIREVLTPRLKFKSMPRTVSLHVRRGDYQQLSDKHPILGMEYYERAIGRFQSVGIERFMVFSDDLPWCRMQSWPSGVSVVKESLPVHQLALTIACEGGHILANSSFSWWGAWLNPNPDKIVIAPHRWYGEQFQAEFNTQDLYLPDWILL